MTKWPFLVAFALLLAAALLMPAAGAQRAPDTGDAADRRGALQQALAERRAAEQRGLRFEREAQGARGAAERTAREAAAIAARIQQAEAGLAAAEARLALAQRARALLREELGREQQPVVHLTAALQQFSRRPVALSVLRPGSVKDVVYLRAMLEGALPQVEARTAGLRGRLVREQVLREQALAAATLLRAEEESLQQRRQELAALEARQRLASREASGSASREAELALTLGERARDLDALVTELDRTASLRDRLAALPGPALRPARPEDARTAPPVAVASASEASAPAPYLLPVTGRIAVGFGAPVPGGASSGLTLVPRPGAQVVAPAAGRVAFAEAYQGYGRIVIVEHAGGWISLVTGLARTDVTVGEQLVPGAPLGVAATMDPRIVLELRREGEAVNPLHFLG